jgi:hypothetical protein
MDDELPGRPDAPEPLEDPDPASPPLPELPAEITSGDEELRRLIAEGASTPEELRDLAARIREHRSREEELWRAEMRPALKKAKKGRVRLGDLVDRTDEPKTPNGLLYVAGLAGVVVVLVLAAARGSVIFVLLPLVLVLGYAYRVGRQGERTDETAPPSASSSSD